jgi:hypothetical protein
VENKKEIYRWIKIGGLISFLPFVLAAGPLAGYFIGDYLQKRFNLNSYSTFIVIALGFVFSIRETIKILKMAIAIEQKGQNPQILP